MPFSFIVTDAEEQCAPPELPVLRVDVVDDRVFLEICEVDETDTRVAYTKIASIQVHAGPLVHGLQGAAEHFALDMEEARKRGPWVPEPPVSDLAKQIFADLDHLEEKRYVVAYHPTREGWAVVDTEDDTYVKNVHGTAPMLFGLKADAERAAAFRNGDEVTYDEFDD